MTVTMFAKDILISIDFQDYVSPFSPQFLFQLRRHIKHSRQCLTTFPNTSMSIKNTLLCFIFPTFFSVFGNVVKHGRPCLIYYVITVVHFYEDTVKRPVVTTSPQQPVFQNTKRFQVISLYLEPLVSDHLSSRHHFQS